MIKGINREKGNNLYIDGSTLRLHTKLDGMLCEMCHKVIAKVKYTEHKTMCSKRKHKERHYEVRP